MKARILLLVSIFVFGFYGTKAQQDRPVHPSKIVTGKFIGISKPLRDMPKLTQEQFNRIAERAKQKQLNESLKLRYYPFAATAQPQGPDPAWQQNMGMSAGNKAPLVNFSGQASPYYPPDCNGAVGPNHYMQDINSVYAIYSKTGTLVAGPTDMNLLFGSVPGASYNDGDPVVLYDEMAGRWLASEFSISGSNDYEMVAISTTSDPTGTWYQYSFDVSDMPDYPKFGVWPDGYYMADNNSSSNDIYVFQRSVMLTGGASPQMIGFNNPYRPTSIDGFMMVPPVDNDGTTAAPTGAPGTFIAFNDDAIGGGADQLWIYELTANWTTPSSSTFNRVQQIAVSAFSADFGSTWDNIAQSGSSQKLDAIPQVIMNVPQYRNFGTYQTIVCCHTVDVDGTDHAGIRWYELRRGTQTSGNWAVRQQGTYAPDAHSRWMGSVMLNGTGKIGLGYSISSSSLYPGIRYTGQSASAYAAATGVMDLTEEVIQTGSYAQSSYNRWGDYSDLSVDPTDDNTFWFTTEYIGSGGTRQTKIASFKFGSNPTVVTLAASSIAATSATLNGTVNPNGLSTTYYFQYGTTTSYGTSTTSTSAGSGTSAVPVSVGISSLTSGTTYHFRVVATNSDGTTNGNDLTFVPGGAVVTTTAASSITGYSAVSGGTVTTDGGLGVTARGVCWATTTGPTVSGSHTSDGTGTGAFTSNITGLSASTTYHYRAYATNSSGTYYGAELSFSTTCGTITSFPWNEGFENGGSIPNCWTQEYVTTPGLDWVYVAGNGGSNPATAHGGSYDACLKDATIADNKTKLVTPSINLASLTNPQLTFYHYMQSQSGRQDQLIVYYRTSAGGAWTTLATYATSVASWTLRTISLPNGTSDYYIAFEGNAKNARGVCIDDVSVTGTAATPTLSVTPSNQNITADAGSTSFSVTSNSLWSASSNQTWCTVTPSGVGNGTITATCTANTSVYQRVANVTVTVTGLTPVVVTVTQGGVSPALAVAPSNQAVTYPAGSTSFTVTSNTNWTASSDQSWCTVTPSGTGNGTITATYALNSTYVTRVANITVSVIGLTPIVVTVTQDGTPPPEFNYVIVNDVQTSDRTLQFDLYLLDTQSSTPFELSIIQAGILVNNGIINGGTITPSIVAGYSDLVALQQPSTALWSTGTSNGCIKITPKAGPGCGSGTTISTSGLGTRICRVLISNSVPFTASSQANLTFNFTTSPYPTKVFQYSGSPCASNLMTTNSTNTFSLATNPVLNGPAFLNVSPSDQPVTNAAGSVPFAVLSNATWSAVSDQTWCTLAPSSGFGNGTITANYTENTVSDRVAHITVSVSGLTPVVVTVTQAGVQVKNLDISLFLEGLYIGEGAMHPAQDENGDHWGPTIADKLSVELHNSSNYSSIVYTASNVVLNTDGTISFSLPSSYNGSYYITILNRNHILTTTADPVSFGTSTVVYTFDDPSKAYGGNLQLMIDGMYVIYAGDVNQDEIVDGTDLSNIGNLADMATSGYLPEDANGDGLIDGSDLSIAGNNADLAIGAQTP